MIALTRAVSPALDRCEISHRQRVPIDPGLATRQHAGYERAITALGCRIVRVPPAPDLPDSVFIEDAAVVVDEVAILARPGAPSRRPELEPVAEELAAFRPVRRITEPGTLDGGDVLVHGRAVRVGASSRTNREGVEQLRAILEPFGYDVRRIPVEGCLHLKTAVTSVSADTLLVNADWVDPACLEGCRVVEVDPAEPYAANVLRLGESVLVPAAHPRTRDRLAALGLRVLEVDVSELAKAEAGVTCCSILLAEVEA